MHAPSDDESDDDESELESEELSLASFSVRARKHATKNPVRHLVFRSDANKANYSLQCDENAAMLIAIDPSTHPVQTTVGQHGGMLSLKALD